MRLAALAGLILLTLPACDSRDPVAPEGAILTITASPGRIGSSGSSRITVLVRKGNGFPVNEGTVVHLDTTLGTLDTLRGETGEDGVVRATLTGQGAVGTAVVTAATGAATDASVSVVIGGGDGA